MATFREKARLLGRDGVLLWRNNVEGRRVKLSFFEFCCVFIYIFEFIFVDLSFFVKSNSGVDTCVTHFRKVRE